MTTLLCCGENFLVEKFVKESRMFLLDIKINSEEEFKKFFKIYEKASFDKGIFDFIIGEDSFKGWFGDMLYDKNYNIRAIVGIYDGVDDLRGSYKVYNTLDSIIGLGNAIRKICDVLERNNIFTEKEKTDILKTLNTPDTTLEFQHLVEDLPLYLKESKQTIEDIKEEEGLS